MFYRLVLFISLVLALATGYGQATNIYVDAERAYDRGLELFQERNFASARVRIEQIYKTNRINADNVHGVMLQNLEFYIAACAAELNDQDAEQLLNGYFKKYHETDKRRLIYFYLGKYYFQNKKFADASEWLAKVKADDLNGSQLIECKFDLGYSYFIKKKFDEAKPLFKEIKEDKEKYYYPSNYYYAFICFYQKNYGDALKSFKAIEDSKMYAAVIPYYISQIYFLNKDYPLTVTYITTNLDRTEVQYKEELNHLLGEAYFQLYKYAEALPLLEHFVAKNEKVRKEDIYELGFSQYMTEAYEKAATNLIQLNLLNEKVGQNATYALADCYLHLGQKDKARSAFQSASTMDFDKEIQQTSLFQFAKLSYELNYSTDAITALENYLKENPSGRYIDESNELLASVLIKTKNYERAYKIMEGLPTMSGTIKEAYQKVTYYRSVEVFNDKKYEEALELCDKSLKFPSEQDFAAMATYLRGECYYRLADYDKSIENYQLFLRAMKPYMEAKTGISEFRAHYNMAYCYFKKKEYKAARLHFKQALDKVTETNDDKGKQALLPDLYMRLADCYFITKDYPNALTGYSKIIEKNWEGIEYAYYQRGIVLGLLDRNNEKITALNALITTYPTSIYLDQAYYEVGQTYSDMEQSNAAIEAYIEVVTRYPKSPTASKAYLKIALSLYNLNKKEEALDFYKKLVSKYPEASESKRAIASIKELSIELGKPDEYASYSTSTAEIDTLAYQAGEAAYQGNDCVRAINLFRSYYTKYPQGIFTAEAHYYRAQCLLKSKDYIDAMGDYEALSQNKFGKYYESALLDASGIAYYELKDTIKAYTYYSKLLDASTSTANTITATLGTMRTAYSMGKNLEAATYADKVLLNVNSKEGDILDALYIKGKAAYQAQQYDVAYINLNRLSNSTVSEHAAEAKYFVAKMLYDKQEFKASMDTCFKIKNRFASYDRWVVRAFMLIADDYYALGNTFQAKATLESIIQNYKGDNKLIEEAGQKLAKMQSEELKKSKIQTTLPSDTLIMERDSIIKK